MIPFVVIMIPIYKMMLTFGWLDKFQALIIPWIFTAAGTFLFRQFFKSIPKDLEEAAIIDGASRWTILWRMFCPALGPSDCHAGDDLISVCLEFVHLASGGHPEARSNYVVTQGLADIQGGYHASPPIIMAGATLVILPTVLVFLLAQRYFVEGVATTGMKN